MNDAMGVSQAEFWEGVWIVIPAFQEERTIRGLVRQAHALCPRVIVVDDGSTDRTRRELSDLPVTLLAHCVNQGKAASLRTAFAYAIEKNARCVVSIDGDGQHDVADIPALLAVWHAQPRSIVIGSRLHDRAQFPPARYRANRFACFWISWAAGHAIADSQSGLRVYSRDVMQLALAGKVRGTRFTFESEILIEAALRGHLSVGVAIPGRYPTHARASHFRPVTDIAKIVGMVAWRLLASGMRPLGLWRSLRGARVLPGRAATPVAALPVSPGTALPVSSAAPLPVGTRSGDASAQ